VVWNTRQATLTIRNSFFRLEGSLENLAQRISVMPEGTTVEVVDNELRFHYPEHDDRPVYERLYGDREDRV
jgi:hypothetical protein